jgi:hypothetical protein
VNTRSGHLIYLSYGQGPHVAQLCFSVLSAIAFQPRAAIPPITVFADRPQDYSSLGVRCVEISPRQLRVWRGPLGFSHVVKLEVLREALRTLDEPCVLVDADTYFRKHPSKVVARVGPGRSVMHLRECRVGEPESAEQRELARHLFDAPFAERDGSRLLIEPGMALWNAGVLGLDPSDSAVLDDAIELTHQVYERTHSFVSEQLSVSFMLQRATTVRPTADAIFHSWPYLRSHVPPYGETDFARAIQAIVRSSEHRPVEERAALVGAHRYRTSVPGRLRWRLRLFAGRVGATPPVVRRSL